MVTDYKNTPKSMPGHQVLPSWAWFLTGLFVGLFCAFFVFLYNDDIIESVAVMNTTESSLNRVNDNGVCDEHTSESKQDDNRFAFYSTLPERKVDVVDQETSDVRPNVVPVVGDVVALPPEKPMISTKPALTKPNGEGEARPEFLLQAGSFRDYADADRRKASLALLGIESKIYKVVINHNKVWYRVRIGPYLHRGQTDKARALLRSKKIETLLVRVRG